MLVIASGAFNMPYEELHAIHNPYVVLSTSIANKYLESCESESSHLMVPLAVDHCNPKCGVDEIIGELALSSPLRQAYRLSIAIVQG
jgi:hypothetical protein